MSGIRGAPKRQTEKLWRKLAASPHQDIRASDLLRLMWGQRMDRLGPSQGSQRDASITVDKVIFADAIDPKARQVWTT